MDADDRTRVDTDMDRLRGNEERLGTVFTHQTNVVETLYQEIKRATDQVNNNLQQIRTADQAIRTEVEAGLNFTNQYRALLALEQDLSEAGLWITEMTRHIHRQQHLFLKVLLKSQLNGHEIAEIINPNRLLSELEGYSRQLPPRQTFPRRPNGGIAPEIIQNIETTRKILPGLVIGVNLRVPIVKRDTLRAYQGIISPMVKNDTIILIGLANDLLLTDPRTDMGYLVPANYLTTCQSVGGAHLCEMTTSLIDLPSEPQCLAEMYYHNQTTSCVIKIVRANRILWIKAPPANEWIYVAPTLTTATITNDTGEATIALHGVGIHTLHPGETITTPHTSVTYYITDPGDVKLLEPRAGWNVSDLGTGNAVSWKKVPKLDTSIEPFLTQEMLLKHAVDVADLQRSRPQLENIVYAPLEHPWLTTPILVGVAVVIALIRCRANINCNLARSRKPLPQPATRTIAADPPSSMSPESQSKTGDSARANVIEHRGKEPADGTRALGGPNPDQPKTQAEPFELPEKGNVRITPASPPTAPSPPSPPCRVILH
uniref:Putative arac family transcriptional regulator n=1 Tax=Anopheles triannulatus TaxID=58253 RepID=A0A2M4ARJ5_9DIPT